VSRMNMSASQSVDIGYADRKGKRVGEWINGPPRVNLRRAMVLVLVSVVLATMSVQAKSQSLSLSDTTLANESSTAPVTPGLTYVRPTPRTTVKNYTFDAFGPYAFVGTALIAGLDQATNTPPEWKQGFRGYADRFGSDFGIAFFGTTARYGLAQAFKEDTSYYRCVCMGVLPRMRHAVSSTFTARRGESGHRVFSFPALVAPYAGVTTAVYGWYPNRYGAKDALRMGNYSLLESVGANIALEFLYGGPHSLLSHMHLNHGHGRPVPSPDQ
jgi:hypothetical protein